MTLHGSKQKRSRSTTAIAVVVASSLSAVSAFATVNPQPSFLHQRGKKLLRPPLTSKLATSEGSDVDGGEGDWRAFRARLVQNGLPFLGDGGSNADKRDANIANDEITDTSITSPASARISSTTTNRYAHECTPLIEVGTVLVSIPTTDLCQALEQQYWHRSVVLITALSNDRVNGDEETVPEEQLAQGANRGRWTYRGVLLNRMTDLVFDGASGEQQQQQLLRDKSGISDCGWRIMRGGDLAGLDASDGQTELTCLHTLDVFDPKIGRSSTQLVGNLSMMSLDNAKTLCSLDPSKYSPGDFFTYGGYCSWRPGQLEMEMGEGRGEWLALSVDARSILDETRQQLAASVTITEKGSKEQQLEATTIPAAHQLLDVGTVMWRNFLGMIGRSESRATERIPAGQLEFYDHMLNIWAEENLCMGGDDNDADEGSSESAGPVDSSSLIGPGTLARATSHVSNDILLLDKEFIRSLILVLEETPEATVGIILNHPLSAAVECIEGGLPLPLRYGGPLDAQEDWKGGGMENDFDDADEEDEIYEGFLDYQNELLLDGKSDDVYDRDEVDGSGHYDEDDSQFIWIHRDAALGSRGLGGGGGSPLGTSGLWMINEIDAINALQSGMLSQEDTMVFLGVCIWEKAKDLGQYQGGLREQIDGLQSLEIVRAFNEEQQFGDDDIINKFWDILSRGQDILTKESFDHNIDSAIDAWAACTDKVDSPLVAKSAFREDLSDAALRAWLGVNLLGDPLGTFVEVKTGDQRRRELHG